MNTSIKANVLCNHLLAMYGDVADNPFATLTTITSMTDPDKTHITTPTGIKHCQPKATVLKFHVHSNPPESKYSLEIVIEIKEPVDFKAFTKASTIEL